MRIRVLVDVCCMEGNPGSYVMQYIAQLLLQHWVQAYQSPTLLPRRSRPENLIATVEGSWCGRRPPGRRCLRVALGFLRKPTPNSNQQGVHKELWSTPVSQATAQQTCYPVHGQP